MGYANIRDGIVYSMNIIALKALMNTVTPQTGYQYALDFGITSLVESEVNETTGEVFTDIGAPLCLGGITHGVSNLELTGAYAAIANQGIYTEPIYYTRIVDRNGKIIIDNQPETHTVIKESTAWLLTNAMEGVCQYSLLYDHSDIPTSRTETKLDNMPTAAKSGTTTNTNDIWFVGYTPYYTLGIWQGYDENAELTTGPDVRIMWHSIMSRATEGLPAKQFPAMPSNIEEASICHKSGKLAVPGVCDADPAGNMVYTEYFARGTTPTEVCDHHTRVTVCSLSGVLATEFCPEQLRQNRIYRTLTDESTGNTDDSAYLLPESLRNSTCPIHTGYPFPFMTGEDSQTQTGESVPGENNPNSQQQQQPSSEANPPVPEVPAENPALPLEGNVVPPG